MNKSQNKPDYPALQKILENDLKREVSDDEARKIGKWVLRFYTHLNKEK